MRKYLVAGVLVWIPIVITIWVLKLLIDTMDSTLLLLPEAWHPTKLLGFRIPGLGVLLTFGGKKVLQGWDSLLSRIPVVRSIYGGVKQISDTLFSPEGKAFRKAVLIKYPGSESWTVALLTGEPQHEVSQKLPGHVAVFIPTTPNITAGFFLLVDERQVIDLDMSVDAALKYIISMGVAEPPPGGLPSLVAAAELNKQSI
jgi:uncharacterized membrane protein